MRTAAYYRSSTNLQEHSVEMQRTMAFKTAKANLYVIEDEYPDPFVSARKNSMKDRPELTRLMDDIEKGRVGRLLVYKRDRLARLAKEYMYLYRFLKEHKVEVVFTADNEHPLSYTAVGEFFEVLMAGVIQREGEQIAKRIRDSKISKFLNKEYAGKLPFGYHIDENADERIVKTPGDIDIAREIYDLVLSQKYSTLNEIKALFDGRGMTRTVVKKGEPDKERQWNVQDLNKILSHPLYMGKHIMTFEGAGEFSQKYDNVAIVSLDEWERVQELLPGMLNKRDSGDETEIVFHMEGLLFCSKCKHPLKTMTRMRNGVNVGMYECEDNSHNCKVRQSHVESLVLERATHLFSSLVHANLDDLIRRYQETNVERLERQMQSVEQELDNLNKSMMKRMDQYLRTTDKSKKDELTEKLSTIYDKTDLIRSQYNELVDILTEVRRLSVKPKQVSDTLSYFSSTLPEREPDEIRDLFKDVVARIDVSQKCIDITFKHPYVTAKDVLDDVAT